MKMWVGVTDSQWFAFLAGRQDEEVNFWQPGGGSAFRAIETGAPFLFKLHYPLHYVVGGGSFIRQVRLPLCIAWDTFQEKNGAPDLNTFRSQILRHRGRGETAEADPVIGCVVLAAPFFFDEVEWIPAPPDWSKNIVTGKTYDMDQGIGARLWQQVYDRLQRQQVLSLEPTLAPATPAPDAVRYGHYLTRVRLGQSTFRALVTEAYQHRCAITAERTLPVLQAAHIKPNAHSGPNLPSNGLLLRADLHILLDQGYMTITPDLRVEVSRRIKEEYETGRDYYALRGRRLQVVPAREIDHPSREFVEWHNQNVYVA